MDGKSVSRERLEQLLPAAYDSYQLLVPALDLMVHNRIETLRQLNQIADALDKRHRLGNIAKVAGSATGILGSAAAAAGVALTPLTLGVRPGLNGRRGSSCHPRIIRNTGSSRDRESVRENRLGDGSAGDRRGQAAV
ncbi:hypothetical protein GBAR_LOCUS38 [Geodia barretti]|uniref:Uncharacterized protein n=1 Tax=Geodia barretti TaxID=519541 RepID=A0AA35QRY0_GEOBA|nr:hypothetical protein GBAR_LOCUS38 [Geodia barretti]